MNTTFSVSGHIFGLAYSSLESGNVLKFRGLKVRKSLLLLQNSFLRVCVDCLVCAALLEICRHHCGFIPL